MATEAEVKEAINSVLNQPSVGEFEITELSKNGEGQYSGICRIKHSEAFTQTIYPNVNGFDEIKFNRLSPLDSWKYDFYVFEDRR